MSERKDSGMLRGLAAADLPAAIAWYTELQGIASYCERPGYAEFRIGDYQPELGLIDRRYAPGGASTEPGGAIVYWRVDDLNATYEKLLAMGAQTYEATTERGSGCVTASVVDPFGNVLGVMYNQHYLDVLNALGA